MVIDRNESIPSNRTESRCNSIGRGERGLLASGGVQLTKRYVDTHKPNGLITLLLQFPAEQRRRHNMLFGLRASSQGASAECEIGTHKRRVKQSIHY